MDQEIYLDFHFFFWGGVVIEVRSSDYVRLSFTTGHRHETQYWKPGSFVQYNTIVFNLHSAPCPNIGQATKKYVLTFPVLADNCAYSRL